MVRKRKPRSMLCVVWMVVVVVGIGVVLGWCVYIYMWEWGSGGHAWGRGAWGVGRGGVPWWRVYSESSSSGKVCVSSSICGIKQGISGKH
ncbi:hypothetical protein L211DRAFT_448039 [Terfezia boudieri ATCC MYA-4762]|uniref:Transmembrane protein n=1 Tax=Terfezia boudieri ATCC MYA-4762 TaxID=1051890 RepID=A0A3N4LHV9_9PEZI|nr:hypothetical protein L211DRAFT_448039 [Terfezia boudieri ATCC MYA-4762]